MIEETLYFAGGAAVYGGFFLLALAIINGYLGIEPAVWMADKRKTLIVWIVTGIILSILFYGR
jgi:hypothetical protein